jgi:hypothetical protein
MSWGGCVRCFVFRDGFDGFKDWIQSIDKIYMVVRSYDNTTSEQYRESIKERAKEVRRRKEKQQKAFSVVAFSHFQGTIELLWQ